MKIRLKPSAIRKTKWDEYLVRFVFGGLITVAAGLITDKYGPIIGGLFLAFPSISPASVTLVQSHKEEQEKKEGKYYRRKRVARQTAGATAAGTALGGSGLLCFAVVIWLFAPRMASWLVLSLAMLVWIAVNGFAWWCGHRSAPA